MTIAPRQVVMASRLRLATGLTAIVLALVGTSLIVIGIDRQSPSRLAITVATSPQSITGAVSPTPGAPQISSSPGLGRATPTHLTIPRIHVDTALVELGLNPDGTIEVPSLEAHAPAGWYKYLASPGEIGPAVLLGHVDSRRDGPAVFFQLSALSPGDTISIRRADGIVVTFCVTTVRQHPKSAFPSEAVYGPVDRPVLRLVTCGGSFDHDRHSYHDNIIVFADLISISR